MASKTLLHILSVSVILGILLSQGVDASKWMHQSSGSSTPCWRRQTATYPLHNKLEAELGIADSYRREIADNRNSGAQPFDGSLTLYVPLLALLPLPPLSNHALRLFS